MFMFLVVGFGVNQRLVDTVMPLSNTLYFTKGPKVPYVLEFVYLGLSCEIMVGSKSEAFFSARDPTVVRDLFFLANNNQYRCAGNQKKSLHKIKLRQQRRQRQNQN
jgi:hypothetical protein